MSHTAGRQTQLIFDSRSSMNFFHVAKYHLSKFKLERVGQRSSPTPVRDLRGSPRGIAGLLVCSFASVALHCIVALLADRSGSIFVFLRIIADSFSLSSLPAW